MKQTWQRLALAVGTLASSVHAIASFSPSTVDGIQFRVAIPASSSISTSAAGPLYFSISAPGDYSWAALGIGSRMAGATIFVMYADGNGNVTISGRTGRGQIMPNQDPAVQSGLTLLAGSGIDANGVMTANVRCTTCRADKSSTQSQWIAAWKGGNSLATTSTSAAIAEHDNHSNINFDLTAAEISADENPFVAASVSPSGTSTGPSPSSTAEAGDDKGNDNNTGGASSGSSSSSGNTGSQEAARGSSSIPNYQKAHGIIMGVTVVLLFPIGAVMMRIVGSAALHAALQVVSLIALIVGFALGVRLADMQGVLFKANAKTHTIFGTVILAFFLIQPVVGIVHHLNYKKTQSRSGVSHAHIWFGRIIMILAVINGGLGLKLAANTKGGEIAYGVVAGVMGVAYILIVVLKRKGTTTQGNFNGLGGRRGKTEREGSNGSQVEMR